MRTLAAVVLVLVLSTQSAGAQSLASQPVSAAEQKELFAARDAVWRAWFADDTAQLAKLLPDVVAAGSPAGWQSRPATLDEARQSKASGTRLLDVRFDSTSIRLRGSTAVLQSRYTLLLEQGGRRMTRGGIATEVFVKQGGRWVNPFWFLE